MPVKIIDGETVDALRERVLKSEQQLAFLQYASSVK